MKINILISKLYFKFIIFYSKRSFLNKYGFTKETNDELIKNIGKLKNSSNQTIERWDEVANEISDQLKYNDITKEFICQECYSMNNTIILGFI